MKAQTLSVCLVFPNKKIGDICLINIIIIGGLNGQYDYDRNGANTILIKCQRKVFGLEWYPGEQMMLTKILMQFKICCRIFHGSLQVWDGADELDVLHIFSCKNHF